MEVTVGNEETGVVLRRVNPEVVRGVVVVKIKKNGGQTAFRPRTGSSYWTMCLWSHFMTRTSTISMKWSKYDTTSQKHPKNFPISFKYVF